MTNLLCCGARSNTRAIGTADNQSDPPFFVHSSFPTQETREVARSMSCHITLTRYAAGSAMGNVFSVLPKQGRDMIRSNIELSHQ